MGEAVRRVSLAVAKNRTVVLDDDKAGIDAERS
jgi:hypothetical protein